MEWLTQGAPLESEEPGFGSRCLWLSKSTLVLTYKKHLFFLSSFCYISQIARDSSHVNLPLLSILNDPPGFSLQVSHSVASEHGQTHGLICDQTNTLLTNHPESWYIQTHGFLGFMLRGPWCPTAVDLHCRVKKDIVMGALDASQCVLSWERNCGDG